MGKNWAFFLFIFIFLESLITSSDYIFNISIKSKVVSVGYY